MMNKIKTLVAALCLAGTALSSAAQDRVTGETPADYAERMVPSLKSSVKRVFILKSSSKKDFHFD